MAEKTMFPAAAPATEPERRASLDRMMEMTRTKGDQVKTQMIMDKNKLKAVKINFLKDIYKMMEEQGVDPNDVESISRFTQELSHQDPDLLELFESALLSLSPEEEKSPAQVSAPNIMGNARELQRRGV